LSQKIRDANKDDKTVRIQSVIW